MVRTYTKLCASVQLTPANLWIPTYPPSIVFSFWTSTLDLASTALTQTGLTCLQVDGKTAPKQRGRILQHFAELETPAVLLMSLSCGAVGYVLNQMPWSAMSIATHRQPWDIRLNLTAASRVYLMEPQWNPAIEEQALARVYRLGQTQPVVTVRFYIKESIEEVRSSLCLPPYRCISLIPTCLPPVRPRSPNGEEGTGWHAFVKRLCQRPEQGQGMLSDTEAIMIFDQLTDGKRSCGTSSHRGSYGNEPVNVGTLGQVNRDQIKYCVPTSSSQRPT